MERFLVKRLNEDIEGSPLIVVDKVNEKLFISETDDDALDCLSYWQRGLDPSELVNGICCECVELEEQIKV